LADTGPPSVIVTLGSQYIDQRIRPKRKAVIRMRLLARRSRMYISAVGQKILPSKYQDH
jgi:hypothetical protein